MLHFQLRSNLIFNKLEDYGPRVLCWTFVLGGGGREVHPKKSFYAARKIFLRPSKGVWEHAPPEKFEKIVFRIG